MGQCLPKLEESRQQRPSQGLLSLVEDEEIVVLINCNKESPKESSLLPLLYSFMRTFDRLLGSTCHQQSWPWMSSKIMKFKLAITRGCIEKSQN